MSEVPFSRWAPEESPVTIDCSQAVLEDIRVLVTEGFQRLARGGVEVGGVLFGIGEPGRVVIHASRPVECTYARGPQFVLSETDRLRFVQVVESYRTDPELIGLVPVGWYVSHTRSELVLNEVDREISNTWFQQPWHVLLILRPGRVGATRAGFFLREPDGELRAEHSLFEFNVDPLRPSATMTADAAPVPASGTAETAPAERKFKKHWIGALVAIVLVLGCLVGAILFFYPPGPPAAPAPIALQLSDSNGEIRVSWNRRAPAIRKARGGVMDISDDGKKRSVPFTPEQLQVGEWPFLRTGGDVSVVLRVKDENGRMSEEVARFLGQPLKPEVVKESESAGSEKTAGLEAEIGKLRKELKQERGRAAGLEKKVSQLTDMLRIERDRSEVLRKK